MGCLYQLTSPSGKRYIGITAQPLKSRWRAHKAHAKRCADGHLQMAIRKYGAAGFSVKTLVLSDDYSYLKLLEQRAIVSFKTKSPRGYNLTDGGDGVLGVVMSEESRVRRSIAQLKSFADPKRKKRHAEAQRSPELAKIRSDNQKAKWADPSKRDRMIRLLQERSLDEEYRAKLRARPKRQPIGDGLNGSARYRLKDVAAYRKTKREYARTDAQKKVRAAYGRLYRARLKQKQEQHVQEEI